MLRAAGGVDQRRLLAFLNEHAAAMPRKMLRYASEQLGHKQREYFLAMKKEKRNQSEGEELK